MANQTLRIFKFGGASIQNADGVRNLAQILKTQKGKIILVISAMGKTTNALEKILKLHLSGNQLLWDEFNKLKGFHLDILNDLIPGFFQNHNQKIDKLFSEIESMLNQTPLNDYNYCYDQLVSYGELLSSTIVSGYLDSQGIANAWVDIRLSLISDTNYREGNVNYLISGELCKKNIPLDSNDIIVTQGFIAGTNEGTTTTLGREGSDYTAALIANLLDAESVTIWKDVEGVLNADPRIFQNTVKLHEVSFKEAIELAYCGAQIIHPKTIKPIQNKLIPLFVRSFISPELEGTIIFQTDKRIEYPPILIQKLNQVLISLTPRDFSFVIEDCLSKIFAILYKHRVKANLVQSSAISFSICVDDEAHFLPGAIDELMQGFSVRYNKNLELLTIRHFTKEAIEVNTGNRQIYLQQLTRSTARFIMAAQ